MLKQVGNSQMYASTTGTHTDQTIDRVFRLVKKIDNIDASKVIKWFLFCFGFLISLSSILMVVWNDGSHNIICWIDSFHFLLLLKMLSILPANNLPVLINEQEYKKNVYVSLPVQVTVTADFQKDFEPGQRR